MREDLYKVGCTGNQNPEVRTEQLNSEQRSGTSRLGFFNLVFAAAVLDAQGCEAALLRRVEVLRESRGKDVGAAQVRAGMAWFYARYGTGYPHLARLEKEARSASRGLWSMPAIPPWEWRTQAKRVPRAEWKAADRHS